MHVQGERYRDLVNQHYRSSQRSNAAPVPRGMRRIKKLGETISGDFSFESSKIFGDRTVPSELWAANFPSSRPCSNQLGLPVGCQATPMRRVFEYNTCVQYLLLLHDGFGPKLYWMMRRCVFDSLLHAPHRLFPGLCGFADPSDDIPEHFPLHNVYLLKESHPHWNRGQPVRQRWRHHCRKQLETQLD